MLFLLFSFLFHAVFVLFDYDFDYELGMLNV